MCGGDSTKVGLESTELGPDSANFGQACAASRRELGQQSDDIPGTGMKRQCKKRGKSADPLGAYGGAATGCLYARSAGKQGRSPKEGSFKTLREAA